MATSGRVALAEDDDALRGLLAEVLRAEGYEVIETSNGRDLFWLVETSPPERAIDVVVTDLRMPGYDGLEVVEAWADVGSGPQFVLMSAFPDPQIRARVSQLGAVLLEKPFDISRLLDVVAALRRS